MNNHIYIYIHFSWVSFTANRDFDSLPLRFGSLTEYFGIMPMLHGTGSSPIGVCSDKHVFHGITTLPGLLSNATGASRVCFWDGCPTLHRVSAPPSLWVVLGSERQADITLCGDKTAHAFPLDHYHGHSRELGNYHLLTPQSSSTAIHTTAPQL